MKYYSKLSSAVVSSPSSVSETFQIVKNFKTKYRIESIMMQSNCDDNDHHSVFPFGAGCVSMQ